MAETKAYLPPEGPQSVHQTNYQYNEAQGVHRIGNSTVHGHPAVMVTVSGVAQRECERRGFEELPADVVDDLVDAETDKETESIVADYRGEGAAEFPVLDGNVDEVADALATGEYDDELDAIEDAENAGEDRTGVQDAIDERREELASDGGDEGAGE